MKSKRLIQVTAIIYVFSLLSACYNDAVIPELPEDPGDLPQDVSFSGDVIPIFDADCNVSGCHSSGGIDPDLTSANAYSELISGGYINVDDPVNSELYQWMKGNRSIPMPVSGSVASYNATVLAWITQGAENN